MININKFRKFFTDKTLIDKLLIFISIMFILTIIVSILSIFALADANYTFTNATGTYYVNNYTTVGTTSWTVPAGYVADSLNVLVVAGGGGY